MSAEVTGGTSVKDDPDDNQCPWYYGDLSLFMSEEIKAAHRCKWLKVHTRSHEDSLGHKWEGVGAPRA